MSDHSHDQNALQIRERSMTKDTASHNRLAIIIEDTENPSRLDQTTVFKTLNYLVDDGIKPAMEEQFTALRNKFTQPMEDIMQRKVTTLSNIMAEAMNRTIDQI